MSSQDRPDTGNVIETVRKQYDALTQSQKRIAEAIVDDPEFVAFATVDKFAQRLGFSPSTIVRFAYKVGLDGYQDLQDRVRTLVRSQMRSVAESFEAASVTTHLQGSTFGASFDNDLEHLRRTILSLDLKALEQAVDILDAAQRIYVSGDITSYSVAHFAALAINRARGNVFLVRADGEGASRLIEIGPEDALLAFTFPPYSRNVLRVVEWAIERGAATIGVTDHAVSPVGRLVSLVVPAVASGLGPQNTLVPAMAIANGLINALALRGEDRATPRYKAVNRLLGQWDLYLLEADEDE